MLLIPFTYSSTLTYCLAKKVSIWVGVYPPKGWAIYSTGISSLGKISTRMVRRALIPKKNKAATSTKTVIGLRKAKRIIFIYLYSEIVRKNGEITCCSRFEQQCLPYVIIGNIPVRFCPDQRIQRLCYIHEVRKSILVHYGFLQVGI